MNLWECACAEQNGSNNVFTTSRGKYFFDVSRKEHNDGAITGTIYKFLKGSTYVKSAGSFRIEGDGTITRAPKFLKDHIRANADVVAAHGG
jgi:hypothetical protein